MIPKLPREPLKLVVDANVLVAELLRERGQRLFAYKRIVYIAAERACNEARYELRKRLNLRTARGEFDSDAADGMYAFAMERMNASVECFAFERYADYEVLALARIPRDPDDWHTVALALAEGADIWTYDADFLGCGIATWSTDTLLAHLLPV